MSHHVWAKGDRVLKRRHRPGGEDRLLGEGTVASVSGNVRVVLTDGSVWRYRDGYRWGSKETPGCGRFFVARIVLNPGGAS
jgi:hypothetical protein